MSQITASSFQFLEDLAKNNNRDWFTENKKRYQKELDTIIGFADALLLKMNEHDVIETPTGKKSLFRIYRDVRFSKDKSPYKTNMGIWFTQNKNSKNSRPIQKSGDKAAAAASDHCLGTY